MARRFFITATNTDIGKTYTTRLLVEAFSKLGHRVGVFKPIETGVTDIPLDGEALYNTARQYNPDFAALNLDDIVPIQYELPAAPYIASKANPIDLKSLQAALAKIEALCDIVLIEGAGGLLVPIEKHFMTIDLIEFFDAKTLLVSHAKLGCINDTLLNLNLLEERKMPYTWAINRRKEDQSFETVSKPYFIDLFGRCPEVEKDIRQIAQDLLSL